MISISLRLLIICLRLGVGALAICVGIRPAAAELPPSYTDGHWAVGSTDVCSTHYYQWSINGEEARFVDERGTVNVERIIQWLPTGFLSVSTYGTTPAQTRWEYRILGYNALQVQNLTTGTGFILSRCPGGTGVAATGSLGNSTPPQGRIGPSFDCSLAKDTLASLICSSDQLAWLDLRFVQAYQALRQQVGEPGLSELRQEAIDFQASVYTTCSIPKIGLVPPTARQAAEACVAQSYQQKRNQWAGRLTAIFQDEVSRPLPQHIELQAALQKLSYIPAAARIDGIYGPTTRAAITAWQMAHNRPSTGTISSTDALLIRQDSEGTLARSQGVPPELSQQPAVPAKSEAEVKADEERHLAISRAEAEKAKAEADKAQADADRARAEAEVLAAKERAEAEARRIAAEQARAEKEARGIQP
jgi:peptidoglycan hydrolase-like protein with peptidoglycan-binding domain